MSALVQDRARRSVAGWWREVGGWILPVVLGIAAWAVIATLLADLRVIPTPWAVLQAVVGDLGVLPTNVGATLSNAAIGYLVGNVAAIVAAVVFVQVPWAERLLMRVAVMSFCVPLVAITPILVVIFPGDVPKQILAGLSVFFTTLIACLMGLRSVNGATVDLVVSMGGRSRTVLVKARLQAMLPSLFAGLQIAAPAAVLGTILGEYLGASRGLGVQLVQAQASFEVSRTWAVALVMSGLAGLVYALAGWVGRRAAPWMGREVSTAVGQPTAPTSDGRRTRGTLAGIGGVLGTVAIVLAGWWALIVVFDLDPYFAKTPFDVVSHLFIDDAAAEHRATVAAGLGVTLRDAGVGYFIGTVAACLVAVLIATSRLAERFIMPGAIVMRSIPLVAMTPLIALVFGRGLLGVTVIVSLVTFFPTLVTVAAALRSAPVIACDVVRSMGGGDAVVTRKVRMLYALPAVFASARIAVPGAIAGATLAEWLATGEGLGSMLVRNFAASQFNDLWATTAVILAVSVALYALIGVLERPVIRRYGTGAA
ncbi:ABC transporter permease [Demequina sp. NBRC 110057]|uniref:ABC transporter permease n=1 Tax=Demequina sp. NBRC 110057 TaxID=1570346 RepID=UPI000A033DE9|nr:ABC transporter permease subunit [Demequina sp. NBRC 110057]